MVHLDGFDYDRRLITSTELLSLSLIKKCRIEEIERVGSVACVIGEPLVSFCTVHLLTAGSAPSLGHGLSASPPTVSGCCTRV